MNPPPIVSTKPLHLINDGGAFDPVRHPYLRQRDTNYPDLWWETFWIRAMHITDTRPRTFT